MKMSDSFLCCDACFDAIGKRSAKAAKIWIDLCSIYTKENGPFDLMIDDELILRQIELLGFVVTTENPPFITVKVIGQRLDEDGLYFCPRGCCHES